MNEADLLRCRDHRLLSGRLGAQAPELGGGRLGARRYDSLVVRIYGDVAVLRGIADNTGSYRGFPFSGKIRYTRVFVRRDGRWQAVSMQQTAMQ